jgi:hypothetical protein
VNNWRLFPALHLEPLIGAGICIVGVLSFVLITLSTALARSWSYHYRPEVFHASPTATPTPGAANQTAMGPTEELSTATLLKRAIVSDLAIFVEEQQTRSDKAYASHSDYVVRHLLLFDPLQSPESLAIFASLSNYYLGDRGEDLYHCLSLRKGKNLEPYLNFYLRKGSTECIQELGPNFSRPSDALLGYALCPSDAQQKAHNTLLINEITAGDSCSNGELAALIGNTQSSAASR